jgi:hypothetical protein
MGPTTLTLFATQLSRHPSLKPLGLETMYARHPGQTDPRTGKRFVPAVHRDPERGASIFMYPRNDRYPDTMLPDGRTIEFHASTNVSIARQLDELVGREVTLYTQLGVGRDAHAREGKVVVDSSPKPGVYLLRLQPRAPASTRWADME